MADGVDEGVAETVRPRLSYPFAEGPGQGQAVEIAPGVNWLRMPLQGPLGFINVWAIAEDGGYAIVDTGIGGPETIQAWREAFSTSFDDRPATRVFATHMHPDHIGMAGWLTRKYDCRLWITRLEFLTCRSLAADTGREAPEDAVRFYRAAGWDAEALETYRARFGSFGKSLHALPDSFRRLRDGDEVVIGGRLWRIVVGCGHSPEHACLYCPELKLLISGDQVLPRISSNVAVFPTEPDADPLHDWMTSLARIKTLVPDEVLVLPAHNDPFHGLHARIDHLIGGHQRALARLRKRIAEPKRVVDVFPFLFRRTIDDSVMSLATGESLAHLNYLLVRGEAVRTRDENGVDWYRAAA
ncbi:MBL fold metallo-hydrolase [Phenylobacterium sp. LjRoot225]|uniref:MBL fold metallo-hydrolase n=1 Tax=Phenylobacterium sp. LjRoot225 TaxID=3342285 RepID=UPI003F500BAA